MTSSVQQPQQGTLQEPAGARIRRHYAAALEARGYRADSAQQAAIDALADWFEGWSGGRRGWLRRPVSGVYLWGGVGRGKSFVMDAFFAAVPIQARRRVHFHAFLDELKLRIAAHQGEADPLARVAREIAAEARLLCFDEFHVHDIGDAMLLGRLITVLVEEGVGLVCTSNYPPSGLCPNPLYRERFAPAIELLEKRLRILQLDAGTDYRERADELAGWGSYLWPQSPAADAHTSSLLGLDDSAELDLDLTVNHHPLRLRARQGRAAWLDFDELCRRPHSSADLLWLCRQFRRLALSGVPRLDGEGIDVQQRFLNFVDIAYDAGVQVVLACADELDALCQAGSHVDFSRTRSRLCQLAPTRISG